ncbi:MAG: biotin--[acetyl-CoA-carboxylase] ligase [Alphaproteobacteria bacterium]|nr:biotin--[acetyl-CoA-carboxylase] ligase [Alphaproteobacteria bacterium]
MANYKLLFFGKIPSTQTYAHELIARRGAADHTAIVAAAQSAGRGRYRRTWVSHHGNLYVSFIFDCPERDARLSYQVAVAVAESLISFGVPARIKWPNDIMVNGKKICGVLIEYSGDFVIVGIGVNIKSNPTVSAVYKTTRMDKYCNVTAMEVLSAIMKNLDIWMGRQFPDVRTRWTELAIGLNNIVEYRGEDVELMGINENGALMLRRGTEYILGYGDEIKIK